MSQKRIRAALESRLAAWAAAQNPPIPVAWTNDRKALPAGEHLRAFLLPAETRAPDLAGNMRSYRGVFQVSVFTRTGTGPARAETLAQALDDLFPVGLHLVREGLNVRTLTPLAPRPAVPESDWYSVPVDCRYAAEELKA